MPSPRRHLRIRPHIWRIERLGGAIGEYLGVIVASDRETAIENACKKSGVVDRERLVARELPREPTFPARRVAFWVAVIGYAVLIGVWVKTA